MLTSPWEVEDEERDIITDLSYGSDAILAISKDCDFHGIPYAEITILNAYDSKSITEWVKKNIGEHVGRLTGKPIYTDLAAWAELNAGASDFEFSFLDYPQIHGWNAFLDYYGPCPDYDEM